MHHPKGTASGHKICDPFPSMFASWSQQTPHLCSSSLDSVILMGNLPGSLKKWQCCDFPGNHTHTWAWALGCLHKAAASMAAANLPEFCTGFGVLGWGSHEPKGRLTQKCLGKLVRFQGSKRPIREIAKTAPRWLLLFPPGRSWGPLS